MYDSYLPRYTKSLRSCATIAFNLRTSAISNYIDRLNYIVSVLSWLHHLSTYTCPWRMGRWMWIQGSLNLVTPLGSFGCMSSHENNPGKIDLICFHSILHVLQTPTKQEANKLVYNSAMVAELVAPFFENERQRGPNKVLGHFPANQLFVSYWNLHVTTCRFLIHALFFSQ